MPILFGAISGFISSMGMRRRNCSYLFAYCIFMNFTTCCPRCKFGVLCANLCCGNYYKFEK